MKRLVIAAILILFAGSALAQPAPPSPWKKDGVRLVPRDSNVTTIALGSLGSYIIDDAGTLKISHGGGAVQTIGTATATISDAAYAAGWEAVTTDGASKHALFDKFEALDAAKIDTSVNLAAWSALATNTKQDTLVDPIVKTAIDTLAELNAILTDANLLDDGAIADSTAIGLATGATHANFGEATDDTLNEMFTAIDTALGAVGSGTGDVLVSGTPNVGEFAQWTSATAIRGRSLANVKADLDLEIGTDVQAFHAYLTDIAGITAAQGDVIYFNGTDWVNLGPGVANQYLKTGGAAANPSWDDPAGAGTITAIGGSTAEALVTGGAAFTPDGAGNILWFEGTSANAHEILLTGRNPSIDVNVYIPAENGDIVLGPSAGSGGFGTDNRLTKTDGTGMLTQITGITVDDSQNITGTASLAASSHIALGADPADAGSIRLPNAGYIFSEANPTGTDVSVIGVDASQVVQIGASGASGVTITPATTVTGGANFGATITPTANDGAALGTTTLMFSDLFLASGSVVNFNNGDVTLTHSADTLTMAGGNLALGANNITMTGSLGATGAGKLTKVWATDLDVTNAIAGSVTGASSGLTTGTGSITFTGPTEARVITIDNAAQELAARNRANTFTENNVFGNADTDTLTLRSLLIGGNSRALWVAASAPTPTYATTPDDIYVGGNVEVAGTVYANAFNATGTGDSYIELNNNATGYTPGLNEFSLYFETDTLNYFRYALDGTEKTVVNFEDNQTLTGNKTFSGTTAVQNTLTLSRGVSAAQLIMQEASGGGTGTVTIQTGDVTSTGYTMTLPVAQGTSGQALVNDGAGVLSWATPTATAAGLTTEVQLNIGGALDTDAGLTFAAGALTIGRDTVGGKVVLFNELGANDYNATIQPNALQNAAATITLPAVTSTLATLGANAYTGAQTVTGAVLPGGVTNTYALGSASAEWSDLWLGDAAVIYGQNDGTNTLTSSASGWTSALLFTGTLGFDANDANITSVGIIQADSLQPDAVANGSLAIQGGQTATNTLKLQAYDTDDGTGAWDDVITITSAAAPTLTLAADGGVTVSSTLALGANNLTMTGSLGATGAGKLTKGWFVDVESTNYPTINGTAQTAITTVTPGTGVTTALAANVNAAGGVLTSAATIANLAATSSAQLFGVLSDETGSASGSPLAVFNVNPTLTGVTVAGDVTSTATAVDWDLIDNNASALSFDAVGKAGILAIVSTDAAEGVTMSGTLGVTGAATFSAGATIADGQVLTFDESAADPNDADIQLSAADGVFKIAAANGANNEDLTFDFDATANTVNIASTTGVTEITFTGINTLTLPAVADPYIYFNDTGTQDWWVGINDTANTFEFRQSAAAGTTPVLSITETGNLIFEGDTDNAHELTLSITDPTADRTITLPDASGTAMLSSLATNAPEIANSVWGVSNGLVFEGATANDHETTLTPTDPTADRTVTVPDQSGEIALVNATFPHDYGAAAVTKAMTAAESRASYITVSNASGDVELNIPAAIPGKTYMVYNNSGFILTFRVSGATGGTIANGKYAFYVSNAADVLEIWEQP